jgi:hypothetical protein
MTTGQTDRVTGILALLEIDGRPISASTGENIVALIQDIPQLPDPTQNARAKLPVYVSVRALSKQTIVLQGLNLASVNDPRQVQSFNEPEYGTMNVLRYDETRGDALMWQWTCEAQRQ